MAERATPQERPTVAITLGDPAGIGPEIVARTLADPPQVAQANVVAVGDIAALTRASDVCGLELGLHPIDGIQDARFEPGVIDVLDQGITDETLVLGRASEEAGRSSLAAIEAATSAATQGLVDAIVTAPINKEAIWMAGSSHLGHTEMLGELTGSDRYQTMFVVKTLRIFFTTRHMSLKEALANVTRASVEKAIRESFGALEVLDVTDPRLAVAAINPHGGENGAFGDEEIEHIGPACEQARLDGLDVVGPIPADSVFHQGFQGRFDAILSHFHDQGHIAAKTVDFEGAVTVTMGLPIIRTSVDHGTAFDIAGKGVASHRGLERALVKAAELAPLRPRFQQAYGSAT